MSAFDLTTIEGVKAWSLANYTRLSSVERLNGGLINYVYRIHHNGGSDILKFAAPHIASAKDVFLDASRIRFEANALSFLDGKLMIGSGSDATPKEVSSALRTDQHRAPKVRVWSPESHVIVMEDVSPIFETIVDSVPGHLGYLLWAFLGQLHASTEESDDLAACFQNDQIQQTRLVQQYEQVGTWLSGHVENAIELGEVATAFGRSLLEPGECLVMGDVWLPSVMVYGTKPEPALSPTFAYKIRIIDWEFCHFGRPCQDIAHFAAHLWLAERRFENGNYRYEWSSFTRQYRSQHDAWDGELDREIQIHAACEILARTIGPFSEKFHDWTEGQVAYNVAFAVELLNGQPFSINRRAHERG